MQQDDGDASNVSDVVLEATRAFVGVAARSLHDISDEVTLVQYRILVLLESRGRLPMGELAVYLDVNPSTITRICDVLVEKKLVQRSTTKDNRRGVQAALTARGRRLVDQTMAHRRRLVDDVLTRLSSEQQRRLARSLTEFARAAGEVSQDAWRLGWTLDDDGSGD